MRLDLDGKLKANASLKDVESAVRRLDGVNHTLLIVEVGSRRLTVGGGPNLFVAEIAENDRHRWALIDPSAGEQPVDLVVGAQLVGYPARLCVSVAWVLEAVRAFVANGGARSGHLTWSVET